MKFTRLITGIAAAAILFALFTVCFAGTKSADDILAQIETTYKQASSMHDDVNQTISITGDGPGQTMQIHYDQYYQQPDKTSIVLKSEGMEFCLYADGKDMTIYFPKGKKYTQEKSPGTISDCLAKSFFGQSVVPGGSIFSVIFLLKDSVALIKKEYTSVDLGADETIDGRECHHLIFHHADMDADVYVGIKDSLVWKVRSNLTNFVKKQHAELQANANLSIIFEEIHSEIESGVKIPASNFEFTPPEGAVKTDNLFSQPEPQTKASIGKQAENFALSGLKEGSTIKLEDYKGKVVMIDFWATWCGPCRKELPILQKMYDQFKEKKFIFIAVNSMEQPQKVQDFITKAGYTFPVALDKEGAITQKYGVTAYPTLFLIDASGKIQNVHLGVEPNIEKTLPQEIETLLVGKSLEQPKPKDEKK
jgi:thiol-disulfide isomerase/thioredoxin